MVATTRSAFDKQLTALQDGMLRLSEMVITEMQQAVQALQCRDMDLACRVNASDGAINRLRYELEEQCYTLLALQQPNAGDMRRIVTTVSVVTNMERMGDHAAGIARLVLRMETHPCNIHVSEFDEMASIAVTSLREAMTALTSGNQALAEVVISRDDQIDRLHRQVVDRLMKLMVDDKTTIECATMMLWASHNLERFGDRVSNICDRLMYQFTGDLLKPHHDRFGERQLQR